MNPKLIMRTMKPLHPGCGLLIKGRAASLAVAALFCLPLQSRAQGTFQSLTITFDGPPLQRPGTQYLVQQYDESGVWFLPIPGSDGFVRNGGGITGYPEDGTAYVQSIMGGSPMFGLDDGSSFDPVSVDLAEYSDVVRDPVTVHFVGYRQDGTVLTDDITTAGIFNGVAPVFKTFSFDPAFSALVRVEIAPVVPWSLDNLVVSYGVPEPGTGTLVVVGAGMLGLRLLRRKARP
jgi:hypothetical protein